MNNEQRKSWLKELYIDPRLVFGSPEGSTSHLTGVWPCRSCDEYSCEITWDKVTLLSLTNPKGEENDDLLVWQFEDGDTKVAVDSQTGGMVKGDKKQLQDFDNYLLYVLLNKQRNLDELLCRERN